MIFGYYYLLFRSFKSNEYPEFEFPEGSLIRQKVKVTHIFWIPFFPLGTEWTIFYGGSEYNMTNI